MKKTSLWIFAVAIAGSGCVTASKYKFQEQRAATGEAALASLRTQYEDLQARFKSIVEQLASTQTSNRDLQQSLESNKSELGKKVSSLIQERDVLSAKLSENDAATSGLRRDLAEARKNTVGLQQKLDEVKAAEAAQRKNYEDLAAGLKAEIAAGEIKVTQLKGRLTVNMVDRILFDSGSAEVKPAGRKVLGRVGALLNQVLEKDIRIEGHTDNVPISEDLRARYPSNWELSTARATSVARYLQDHAKVDPKRLVAAGLGEWRPVAPNDKPESRALNRRIEIILAPRE